MITLWNMLFYKPIYNALFFLVEAFPGHSLFLSVVVLTLIVRLIISPLSHKSLKTQIKTKAIQPALRDIKKKYPDTKEQAQKTLELYRKEGINPFSSFFLLLVQFPIIIALYWVFKDGGVVDPSLLYSFVPEPSSVSFVTFGLDLREKSLLLAFLTGFTQFIYLAYSASTQPMELGEEASDQEKMMNMMQRSMKYTMPIMITVFAYIIGSAVALYWLTSNIFMIIQERISYRKIMETKNTD